MISKKKQGFAQYLVRAIIIAAVYLVGAKIGLSLAFFNSSVSPVWPPIGIAVAALVILGYRFWPSVFFGAFIINFITTPSISVSSGIALGNTLEAFFGAYLINRFAGKYRAFENIKNTQMFFTIALIVPIISAAIGILSLNLGGFLNSSSMLTAFFTWWIGDVLGILVFVPIIFVFYFNPSELVQKDRYFELFLTYLFVIFFSTVLFLGWPVELPKELHFAYLAIPILLRIAFRFDLRVTTVATLIISATAVLGTAMERSVFNVTNINSTLIFLQLFVMITIFSIISVSVTVTNYKRLMRKQIR